jgi:hypothetical protein
MDPADIHGQFKFNFRHAAISRDDSKRFLDWAFWRDFESNGPSLYRMCQTMLHGWQRYKDHPDPRVRERFAREVKKLSSAYNAALWAMEREFKKVNRGVSEQIHKLRREVEKEFPVVARLTAAALGPILLWSTRREERRLAAGRTYEPPTFLERRNWVAAGNEDTAHGILGAAGKTALTFGEEARVLMQDGRKDGTHKEILDRAVGSVGAVALPEARGALSVAVLAIFGLADTGERSVPGD